MSLVIYTICTCSHLPQAKIMMDSFLQLHPRAKAVIGLADQINQRIDIGDFSNIELIEASVLQIDDFDMMCKQ